MSDDEADGEPEPEAEPAPLGGHVVAPACRPRSANRFSWSCSMWVDMSVIDGPLSPDPRVDERIDQIDDQVDEHEHRRDDHHDRQDDGEVLAQHGFDDRPTEAGDEEDVLDDERAADQRAGGDAEDRDEREQRGPQRVLEQDRRGATPPWPGP